ncbi:hypothetical protein [Niabella beijingensis]|uniref:hypothetical protein n=1 Tax=Niabella beijingensis TaxID=2872700 RepID=UPI001CBC6813|nr:hypothetical protein [Niabella beijingensis]MBZ4190528.1 hypothetical protein [Niabella beijingensis]
MKIVQLLGSFLLLFAVAAARGTTDSLPRSFSIGIFYGPTPELTNDEQYRFIKEANIDFIQYLDGTLKDDTAEARLRNFRLLDRASRHGLQYYVYDPHVKGNEADIAAMVALYKNHPGLGGYFIVDEPGKGALDWPARAYRTLVKYDPVHPPSVNLLPAIYPDYEQAYVEDWVQKAGRGNLRQLSFDHYPLLADGSFGKGYFNNLDIIRRVGLRYGIPTATYPQSMGILNAYRRPNSSELRYSAYTAVAYGVKQLVWFTYNTPVHQPSERFTNAIIDSTGKKTDLYLPFQKLNAELKLLGGTLRMLDAVAVYHSDTLDGTAGHTLPDNFFWRPSGNKNRVIVSHFRHAVTGQSFIMVVNKSLVSRDTLAFVIDKKIKKIRCLSAQDGKQHRVHYKAGSGRFEEVFLPGEGRLYAVEGDH